MSEFSDCYFLRTSDPERVSTLLKRARRFGMILPGNGTWVPFVVEGLSDVGGVAEDVLRHNDGVLLHLNYADDHGVWLSVYDGERLSFRLDLQRRGPSELTVVGVRTEVARLELVGREGPHLDEFLTQALTDAVLEPSQVRDRLAEIFRLDIPGWLSCADLSRVSQKELKRRFPDAQFVLAALRGKADKTVEVNPNEWCPREAMPAFMYLPVPDGEVDESELERHVTHWLVTGDYDDDLGAGFWMYTAYQRALPTRYAYLADRIMNLQLAFPGAYEAALRQTLRGVIAVCPRNFDWEPYLARKAGEQRL